MWSSSWSILATQRKLGRLIIDETPGLRPCTGCWTHQNTPRPLRGPLQRTCGPRTARGAALETGESRGAAGAQKMCVGARALRARSAALSKVIVRTEQNNFAGGGAVAGLVLRAPVEQMLWAPKTHHDMLYRMLGTRQNSPRPLRGALRRAGGGAERSAEPRGEVSRRRRCPHSVCGGRGAVGGSSTALPACGREHHPMYSTPGVRP